MIGKHTVKYDKNNAKKKLFSDSSSIFGSFISSSLRSRAVSRHLQALL